MAGAERLVIIITRGIGYVVWNVRGLAKTARRPKQDYNIIAAMVYNGNAVYTKKLAIGRKNNNNRWYYDFTDKKPYDGQCATHNTEE